MPTGNSACSTPALVLLSGLPGAGKTTFAAALARRRSLVHIESDAIRRSVAPEPSYTRAESARVFEMAEARAVEALAARRLALVDATNVANADRARFVALARRSDVPLVAVRLVAPKATIRDRLAQPREGYSQADWDVYRRMKPRVEPFAVPVIVVDSRFDPGPSLDLVELLLDAG